MKAGTTESMKFMVFRARLRVSKCVGVGVLELLWQLTARSAPAGDIGRFSDEEIAAWMEWTDTPPEALIEALVESKFLRSCTVHRLVVNDWPEHCPAYVRGGLVKARRNFAVVGGWVTVHGEPANEARAQAKDAPEVEAKVEAKVPPKVPPKVGSKVGSTKPSQAKPTTPSTPDGVSPPAGEPPGKPARKRFTPPTVEEVAAYCRDRDSPIDPQAFVDHYEAVGWVVGKNRSPMKDWQAAVRNWEAMRRERGQRDAERPSQYGRPLSVAERAAADVEYLERQRSGDAPRVVAGELVDD